MTDPIQALGSQAPGSTTPKEPVLPEAFDQFVGDTFFRQMLKSLRSTTGKPAYFHGGQAEEMFQSQLDELLISEMAAATKDSFSTDLFEQQFPNHSRTAEASSAEQTTNNDSESTVQPVNISPRSTDTPSPISKFDKSA